ncbi:MAG TPA: hypothetical protein VGO48_07940 [Conexibacter sp.]|jgi:hypothetical protein|nr:hypothetical protein [Conexibacter sp.]
MALGEVAAEVPRSDVLGARPRTLRAGELAWIGLLPCAALLLAAIVVLGPPLGKLAFPHSGLTFWPSAAGRPSPEPTEQARFLLALTGPLLLTGFVALGLRRRWHVRSAPIAGVVTAVQVAALAFVVLCGVVQYRHVFHLAAWTTSERTVYFKPATLVAAAAIALVIAAGLANERMRRRFGALMRESRGRRIAGTAVAVAAIATWLLTAVNFEGTIVNANEVIVNHFPYWLDEVFAALNGRLPLVHYAAQYGSLWPYPIAGAMKLFGVGVGTFTIATATISAAAMLAVFATFRRVAGSTVAGLLLFLPFLATSFYMMEKPFENRYAISNLFGTFPLRYAGPLMLAWLVARHLGGASPRRARWLFLAAGLVVLNNAEFGIPALGATVAALLWSGGWPARRRLGTLALEALVGLVAALALVSVLTLATAGSLPHVDLLFRYSRLFAVAGWGMLPMTPTIGTSTVIYLTYVAAIGAATVRAANRDPDRLLTGLLAWSGVFGLGIGSYYMGRSHPEVLTNMFAAWALSLTLLLVLAVRTIAARPRHRPTVPEVACLFAFGVLVCSLAQMPTPWSQVSRLQNTGIHIYGHPVGETFIDAHTDPGEAVAILTPLGHRVAYNAGITDVTPYTGGNSMPTVDQFEEMLRDLRAAGGRKVFLSVPQELVELPEALVKRGYTERAREPFGMAEFSASS